ncbi:hypothetical protein D3C72_971670 [compost metagenome]
MAVIGVGVLRAQVARALQLIHAVDAVVVLLLLPGRAGDHVVLERAGSELAFDHALPLVVGVGFAVVGSVVVVVARLVLQEQHRFVAARAGRTVAVVGAGAPVGRQLVFQAGGVVAEIVVGIGAFAHHLAVVVAHRRRQPAARQLTRVYGGFLPDGLAVLVDGLEVPGQLVGQPRIQRQGHRIPIQRTAVVGVAFFVRGVQAVAEGAAFADASAQIHVLAQQSLGHITQFNAAHRFVGRPLGHVVDNSARRTKAIHEARRALQQVDLFKMLIRQRRHIAQEGPAVDAVGILPIQRQTAHSQVAGPGAVRRAVVADGRIQGEHVAQLVDLPFRHVGRRDHGG